MAISTSWYVNSFYKCIDRMLEKMHIVRQMQKSMLQKFFHVGISSDTQLSLLIGPKYIISNGPTDGLTIYQ